MRLIAAFIGEMLFEVLGLPMFCRTMSDIWNIHSKRLRNWQVRFPVRLCSIGRRPNEMCQDCPGMPC